MEFNSGFKGLMCRGTDNLSEGPHPNMKTTVSPPPPPRQ